MRMLQKVCGKFSKKVYFDTNFFSKFQCSVFISPFSVTFVKDVCVYIFQCLLGSRTSASCLVRFTEEKDVLFEVRNLNIVSYVLLEYYWKKKLSESMFGWLGMCGVYCPIWSIYNRTKCAQVVFLITCENSKEIVRNLVLIFVILKNLCTAFLVFPCFRCSKGLRNFHLGSSKSKSSWM